MGAEHPGKLIVRMMCAEGLTQTELARSIGISKAYMCDICQAKRGTSVQIARKLAKALGMTPHFWMYQQVDYDLNDEGATR